MKIKKNKGRKTLTAVGAVVAAGLAPGIVAATPTGSLNPKSNVGITAADVVVIDGKTYGFDELYAMQQVDHRRRPKKRTRRPPQVASKYGAPPPPATTLYGVRPPQSIIVDIPVVTALDTLQLSLVEYCAQLIDADANGIIITLDSDLTRDLGMDADQLKELKAEIKLRYGVELSFNRFYLIGQLNTLRLVSEYIYKLTNLWD